MRRAMKLVVSVSLFAPILLILYCDANPRIRDANVIMITVDTLRYDHTPFGGYHRRTMPSTASFFQNGINFLRAETVRTQTTPAYASMLTGLYPYKTGVRELYAPLHSQIPNLPEELKKHGYQTAAFVSSFVMIGRFSGFNHGFDTYDDFVLERELSRNNYERTAPNTVDHVIPWLKNVRRDKPFFLFLHFIDPHSPYHPPEVYSKQFKSEQHHELERANIPDNALIPGTLDQYQYIDSYDGEIAYLDSQLERLYSIFKQQGFEKNTWFLFAADHGESLGDHGIYFRHGNASWETQSRIPMVWLPPLPLRSTYKSAARKNVVSLVDVTPTILDFLGIHSVNVHDGESLLPIMRGKKQKNANRFIERMTPQRSEYAVVDEQFKLIKYFNESQTTYGLFDLTKDPAEQTNLIGSMNIPSELNAAVDSYINHAQTYNLGFKVERIHVQSRLDYVRTHARESSHALSESDIEKLKALGYVQ